MKSMSPPCGAVRSATSSGTSKISSGAACDADDLVAVVEPVLARRRAWRSRAAPDAVVGVGLPLRPVLGRRRCWRRCRRRRPRRPPAWRCAIADQRAQHEPEARRGTGCRRAPAAPRRPRSRSTSATVSARSCGSTGRPAAARSSRSRARSRSASAARGGRRGRAAGSDRRPCRPRPARRSRACSSRASVEQRDHVVAVQLAGRDQPVGDVVGALAVVPDRVVGDHERLAEQAGDQLALDAVAQRRRRTGCCPSCRRPRGA